MPTTYSVVSLGSFATLDTVRGVGGLRQQIVEDANLLIGNSFGSAGTPLSSQIVTWADGSSDRIANRHDQGSGDGGGDDTFTINGGAEQIVQATATYSATVTFTDGTPAQTLAVGIVQDSVDNLYWIPDSNVTDVNLESNPLTPSLNSISIETITFNSLLDNGNVAFADDRESTFFTCFASGTMISTPLGQTAIERLKADKDFVSGVDGEELALRWVGKRMMTKAELRASPKLRPVRITQGALGNGLPERDLLVSRQHRILVSSKIVERMFGGDVLIAAIKLTALPGIYVDESVEEIEYVHLLFDEHEIIYAEGTPSESLYTGPEALKAVSPEALEEIRTIFPELADRDYQSESAAFIPENKKQKKMIARHVKNGTPVFSGAIKAKNPATEPSGSSAKVAVKCLSD